MTRLENKLDTLINSFSEWTTKLSVIINDFERFSKSTEEDIHNQYKMIEVDREKFREYKESHNLRIQEHATSLDQAHSKIRLIEANEEKNRIKDQYIKEYIDKQKTFTWIASGVAVFVILPLTLDFLKKLLGL